MYDPLKCPKCGGRTKPLFTTYYCDACERPNPKKGPALLSLDRFSNSTMYLGGYANGDASVIANPKTKWDLYKYIARVCYLLTELGGVPDSASGPLGGAPACLLLTTSPMGTMPPITLGRDVEGFLENILYFKKMMTGTMTLAGNTPSHGTHKINFLGNFNIIACDDANAVMYVNKSISITTYGAVAMPGYLTQVVSNTRELLAKKGWSCVDWDVAWNVVI